MAEVQIGRFVLVFLLGGRAEATRVSVPEPTGSHLSIGEVLAHLHDEFPDVTVSKIRFLESQGLIDPERTPSGYRRFYAPTSNGCAGSWSSSASTSCRCGSSRSASTTTARRARRRSRRPTVTGRPTASTPTPARPTAGPRRSRHPDRRTGRRRADVAVVGAHPAPRRARATTAETDLVAAPTTTPTAERGHTREELSASRGSAAGALEELESYGLARAGRGVGRRAPCYDDDARRDRPGRAPRSTATRVRARHLRMYQHFAEREAELFIQVLHPLPAAAQPGGPGPARRRARASSARPAAGCGPLMLRRALRDAWPE